MNFKALGKPYLAFNAWLHIDGNSDPNEYERYKSDHLTLALNEAADFIRLPKEATSEELIGMFPILISNFKMLEQMLRVSATEKTT